MRVEDVIHELRMICEKNPNAEIYIDDKLYKINCILFMGGQRYAFIPSKKDYHIGEEERKKWIKDCEGDNDGCNNIS